jgi:hypothetical protein
MGISKQWLLERIEKLQGDIFTINRQAECSHVNAYYVRMKNQLDIEIGPYIKRCPDCGLDVLCSEKKALPEIKKYHEQKLKEINEMIGKDDG